MVSQLDVPVVRLPAENSLELIEPILFSRKWREQLHYDVCVFGKCFTLGSRIPMRVKLTPLVDLECHWIRLPARKVLLFEKQAGLASYSTYPGSTMRIMTDEGTVCPSGTQPANLLGKASETSEIKLEVQLPRCPEMRTKEKRQSLHFSTKGGDPEVNHWIQLVLCLSTKGKDGMGSSKPRPVELTIESPFTILSCKATPANIYVPPYAVERDIGVSPSQEGQCGCGGIARSMSLASRHEAEAPETESIDNSTSIKAQLPGDITRPLSLDSSANGIKQPARAHLPDWDLPPDGFLPRTAPYGSRQ
ncbi:arrestin C-terminal domain-containing protein, partial [Aspergillus thermomutatus]